MPRVREEQASAFAHCVDPLCDGMAQQPVDVVRTTTELTCRDLGGDSNLVERSATTVRLVDESLAACPSCGGHRDVTEQKRPQYAPLSGLLAGWAGQAHQGSAGRCAGAERSGGGR
jgi:hypothetical protein